MRISKLIFGLLLLVLQVKGQDKVYARLVVDTLTSDGYAGRGYVQNGHNKAAGFIASEFERFGLEKFGNDYTQDFNLQVNTFPSNMDVKLGSNQLYPGVDYIVHPSCPSIKGKFTTYWFNEKTVGNSKKMGKFLSESNLQDAFLIVDPTGVTDSVQLEVFHNMIRNPFGAKGIILVQDSKLTWSVTSAQWEYPVLLINRSVISAKEKSITLDIKAKLKRNELTSNVVGYVKGKKDASKYIVVSAHYDHLGMMGKDAVFPGANDNASGIAMMLNMAQHYSEAENKPDYSIVFIAFGAEEVGLIGSKYFVEHPYFPLDQIVFQVNIDIMGTGDDGITVVNGSVHGNHYNKLVEINDSKGYVKLVKKRGEAANSDHHFFHQAGVPAIFIYTMGGAKHYHDIYDTGVNLTLFKYNEVFKLLTEFIATI